jgi:hypothetical protein
VRESAWNPSPVAGMKRKNRQKRMLSQPIPPVSVF